MSFISKRLVAEEQGEYKKISTMQHLSLYCYWCHFVVEEEIDLLTEPELSQSGMVKRSIFFPIVNGEKELPAISDLLKIDIEKLKRLCGEDIGGLNRLGLMFQSGLRFCAKCLEIGYHSVVYQHMAIDRCPLHNIALETRCRTCHRFISATFRSAILSPFECPHCDEAFCKTVRRIGDAETVGQADHISGVRREELLSIGPLSRTLSLALKDFEFRIPHTHARFSRLVQRSTLWLTPPGFFWTRFRSELMILKMPSSQNWTDSIEKFDIGDAAQRVIIWIQKNLGGYEQDATMLANQLGTRPLGLRLNARTSVVGAAFFKLLVAYDLVEEAAYIRKLDIRNAERVPSVCKGEKIRRQGDGASEWPELDYRLIQLEMLGLFSQLLVQYPNDFPLKNIRWSAFPHAISFAPAWHIQKEGSKGYVEIRTRATELSVLRLLQRRRGKMLSYVEADPTGDRIS